MNHIFYDTKDLNKSDYVEIINYASNISYELVIDKLDVENSWSRQKVKMFLGDYIQLMLNNKHIHFTVVKRYNPVSNLFYGEVSVRTSKEIREKTYVDYFLWIYMKLNDFEKLIKKFKLK
jgi:hypothetical protein